MLESSGRDIIVDRGDRVSRSRGSLSSGPAIGSEPREYPSPTAIDVIKLITMSGIGMILNRSRHDVIGGETPHFDASC